MKFKIHYIFKVSLIIALFIFVIERMLFANGFNLPINELILSFSIQFMYAFVLSLINFYFFYYLGEKVNWKGYSVKRLIIGVLGSIILTMIGLIVLRFITVVFILGKPIAQFINDKNASTYYIFGLIITLVASLFFHAIYFYKALTEKKVNEQQIVAKTETAKYETLKSQIDPHFLFNSLNVLTSLIGENPKQAEKFTTKLSKVYRYVLEQKSKDLIKLDEELHFAKTYMELLKMRFENAVTFEIPEKATNSELKIVPLSLQLLLENTIKHNVVSEENPLKVTITEESGYLIVSNNFNPKATLEKGTKVGLKNIIDRYHLITLKKVLVEKSSNKFIVKLPLLTQKIKTMKTSNTQQNNKYLRAVERVEEIKGFYASLIAYCIVIPFLIFMYFKYTPHTIQWFWFPAFGWGIGLTIQGFKAFSPVFGSSWEDRKIQEFMNEDDKQYWE
ncbi:MAG: histidine kinase [Lutibacter sp.]|uniref:histidine kinase n=1 Tax=Lutibacter sp. TaxID=1925666 RepID=UPI00385E6AC9